MLSFDQDMQVVPSLDMLTKGTIEVGGVTKPVLAVEVIPDETSNPNDLRFDWHLTEMTKRSIKLQLHFH